MFGYCFLASGRVYVCVHTYESNIIFHTRKKNVLRNRYLGKGTWKKKFQHQINQQENITNFLLKRPHSLLGQVSRQVIKKSFPGPGWRTQLYKFKRRSAPDPGRADQASAPSQLEVKHVWIHLKTSRRRSASNKASQPCSLLVCFHSHGVLSDSAEAGRWQGDRGSVWKK